MVKLRVRWQSAVRLGALVASGCLALAAGPALFRAPDPPPLARDIGLPRVVRAPDERSGAPPFAFNDAIASPPIPGRQPRSRHHDPGTHRHGRPTRKPAADAAADGTPPGSPAPKVSAPPLPPTPTPAPTYIPATPQPPPAASPAPAPAPPPAGDGSEEFAPH